MTDIAAKVIGWAICTALASFLMLQITVEPQSDTAFLWLWFFFFTTCVAYEVGNYLAEFIKRQFQR